MEASILHLFFDSWLSSFQEMLDYTIKIRPFAYAPLQFALDFQ